MVAKQVAFEQNTLDAVKNPFAPAIAAEQATSWKAYLDARTVINQPGSPYRTWAEAFKKATDAVQNQHIDPLARAHAAWMQSNLLANTLECTHDGEDALSGDVYAETLQRCMAGTQQIDGCRAVYERWLEADITEKTNLLLRGLVLKQEALIQAFTSAPLDPTAVPWQSLRDHYTTHVKTLLQPNVSAAFHASTAQASTDKAKKQYDDAFQEYAQALAVSPGLAWTNNPIKRNAETAEANWKSSQARADEAKRDTTTKLLPDSVANLLIQATAPLSAVLNDFNESTAQKTLMRWMVAIGVTLGKPIGVFQVTGKVSDTTAFLAKNMVDNLAAAAEANGKPMSSLQKREYFNYAKKQVRANFPTGNYASFETKQNNGLVSKVAVFLTADHHPKLADISDPTEKIRYLAANVKAPANLDEYGLLSFGARKSSYGAIAEGVLTVIDATFKYKALVNLQGDEAKAMSFQKTGVQDTRIRLNKYLFMGAIATGATNTTRMYATWRSTRAMGLTIAKGGDKLVERATLAVRVAGTVTGVLTIFLGLTDLADAIQERRENNYRLAFLYGISSAVGVGTGAATIAASWAGGDAFVMSTVVRAVVLRLTWNELLFALAVLGWAISWYIDKTKGDNVAQWLERCYWGNSHARFGNANQEQQSFQTLMAGA